MFSQDWSGALESSLRVLYPESPTHAVNCLEIGCFEGRGTNLILNKVCSHPESKMYCVDHWEDTYITGETSEFYNDLNPLFVGQFNTFQKNTEQFQDKLVIKKGLSNTILPTLPTNSFDFIYIDGDHHPDQVYLDAVHSFPLLKSGGIMLFDDYLGTYKGLITRDGIDRFYNEYKSECQNITPSDRQFAILKL
jgi:hypothetical protein